MLRRAPHVRFGLCAAAFLAGLACSRRQVATNQATPAASAVASTVAPPPSAPQPSANESTPAASSPAPAPAGPSFALTSPALRGELIPGPGVGQIENLVDLDGALFAAINPRGAGRAGGVFRSDDGGFRFRRASKGLPRVRWRSFRAAEPDSVFDPFAPVTALATAHGVLLAGTGQMQIFRSLDGGENWIATSGLPAARKDAESNRVEQFATVGGRTYTRTQQGVFVSSDQGATWSSAKLEAKLAFDRKIESFAVDDGVLYAAAADGVLVSEDEGSTFRVTALPDVTVAVHARNGIVYAAPSEPGKPIYVSRDRGKTFRPRAPDFDTVGPVPLALYPFGLKPPAGADPGRVGYQLANTSAVLETKDALLLATFDGLVRTRDRAATLERTGNGLCGDAVGRVAVTDSRLFVHLARERAGLHVAPLREPDFRSSAYGGNEAGAFVARGKQILVGDEQGRVFASSDEGASFTPVMLPPATPPGPVELVAWRGKNRLLVRGGILVSRDAGRSWKDLRAGFPLEPEELFGAYHYKLACGDVTTDAVLLCGPTGVLRGSEKEDWSVVPLPGDVQNVIALASDAGRVYAATRNTLYVSGDDGRSFRVLATSLPGGLSILSVGAEQGELVVSAGNRAARSIPEGAALLFSRDQGKTWLRISDGLDFLPRSPPVRGPDAWYVGLESDGVFHFRVPAVE